MVFAVVEKKGTVVMNDGEELDSWSVIINGEGCVEVTSSGDPAEPPPPPRFLRWGDSFGIPPTSERLLHRGVMRTTANDCQFVCVTQEDYCKILRDERTKQRRHEDEEGKLVLVTEPAPIAAPVDDASATPPPLGHKVIRGTAEKLMAQLVDDNSSSNSVDATFVEDFLLTHRTFFSDSLVVAEKLLTWFEEEQTYRDRITRVLLLWVHNHFPDFETSAPMMSFLERFEKALEAKKKSEQLRLLLYTCAAKARQRVITLTRSSREEPLRVTLDGGHEKGCGIFVVAVEPGSKAEEVGLKRGDQVSKTFTYTLSHKSCVRLSYPDIGRQSSKLRAPHEREQGHHLPQGKNAP